MKLSLATQEEQFQGIHAYDVGWVQVQGKTIDSSVIVQPGSLDTNWQVVNMQALTREHFDCLAKLDVEIILLGTGKNHHFPPSELLRPLLLQGIALEPMHTAAACRTYNILVGEGRSVAAALIMIEPG